MSKFLSLLTFSCLTLSASLFAKENYFAAIEHIKNLPPAPEGFKWVVNPNFTDEFKDEKLDENKWFSKSPYWRNGRPPATFKAENVSLKDGFLQIKNTILEKPEGLNSKEGDIYKFAGGAVASKSAQAHFGYYETRMKASKTPMSSTFWMMNTPEDVSFVDENGKKCTEYHCQELDIIETIGTPTTNPSWNQKMNSNTHYRVSKEGEKGEIFYSKNTPSPKLNEASCDDFHTYGCWWVDANTFHFYYDGKYMFTIKPSQKVNLQPFARPMYLHLVTETYNWEKSLPTAEMLADESKNKTLYDWVRSYRLVSIQSQKK